MKATATKTVTITLTLNEREAKWLMDMIQHPFTHDVNPDAEDGEDADMRCALFAELQKAIACENRQAVRLKPTPPVPIVPANQATYRLYLDRPVQVNQQLVNDDFASTARGEHEVKAIFVNGHYVAIENSRPTIPAPPAPAVPAAPITHFDEPQFP